MCTFYAQHIDFCLLVGIRGLIIMIISIILGLLLRTVKTVFFSGIELKLRTRSQDNLRQQSVA